MNVLKHNKENPSRLNIAVLMGGTSSEREISLKSGMAIVEGLEDKGFAVTPMELSEPRIDVTRLSNIDCVFIALHGGFGENGQLQSDLEHANIPFTGSGSEASRLCMNKMFTKDILSKAGFVTPAYRVAHKHYPFHKDDAMQYPVAVKPLTEGSSIGLSCVKNSEALMDAIEKAWSFGDEALIEEWVYGDEITVGILGDMALPLIQIRPAEEFYSYTAKYDSEATRYIIPAPLSNDATLKIQKLALEAFRTLDCYGYARIDFILGKNQIPNILEVNTVPGFTMTSLLPKAAEAVQLSFADLCGRIVEFALLRHRKKTESSL